MELESRIRNLVWTVSGDYTLKLNPDVERYAKEPDTVLYDTIRQGAFSCYFDREAYSLYLVKKVYSGAAEGELMMLAQLVTEEAVSKRLESERPGVKGFRRRAAEEILDHSFESLSKNETGRLKLEYLRGRREEGEGKSPLYSGKTREWMELLKHASETADTMELIRVTDELYNKVVDPAFVKKHGDLASVLAVTIEELTEYSWKDFLSEELYEDGLETYLERVSLDMTNFTSKEAEEKKEKIFQCDYLKVDWEKHQVSIDGKEVHLTPMEYKILKLLIDNRGKVLTHNYILSQIWGSAQGVEAANLRVFMAALRRKIEKDPGNCRFILTEIGVGYRFREATE